MQIARRELPPTLIAAAPTISAFLLSGVSYWALGYRFGVWPQPPMLEYALHYRGALSDWYTNLPAPHWAFSHLLALAPVSRMNDLAVVLWVLEFVVLWLGVLSICRTFGVSRLGAVGVCLLVLATRLDALGLSAPIDSALYPIGVAFALATAALAALLNDRMVVAGALLGAATVCHPGVGLLSAVVLLSAAAASRRGLRDLGISGCVFAVLAIPPVLKAWLDQANGSSLSAARRFELVAVVRHPHHMLYQDFPRSEYLQVALWAAALAVGLVVIRDHPSSRRLGTIAGTITVLCTVGAAAGLNHGPLALVQIQTARVTPLIVLLGIVVSAAALSRLDRQLAPFVILALPLVVPGAANHLAAGLRPTATDSSFLAAATLLALVVFLAAHKARLRLGSFAPGAAVSGLTMLVLVGNILLVANRNHPGLTPEEQALSGVAQATARVAGPADVVLTPPDITGFRFESRRPIVVDFGNYRFGKGEAEWARRIVDVTGRSDVLEAKLLTPASSRDAALAAGYERTIATSTRPVCRYHVRYVVTRVHAPHGSWLSEIYRNDFYALSKVKPGSCS